MHQESEIIHEPPSQASRHREHDRQQLAITISLSPLSIFLSGMLIGVLVMAIPLTYFGARAFSSSVKESTASQDGFSQPPPSGSLENIKAIGKSDHILGDAKAPVKIVEFSDTECPFCKRFHPTMQQILNEYQGKVAWVYRHFPLESLHRKARKEAEAIECANELGGNEKFWAYLDRILEITPSNDGLDSSQLPQIAKDIGVDQKKFEDCLNSGKYTQHVTEDLNDATNSGGQGTPYSIVIAPNGKKYELSGAQPYEAVKQLVDLALQQK